MLVKDHYSLLPTYKITKSGLLGSALQNWSNEIKNKQKTTPLEQFQNLIKKMQEQTKSTVLT